MESMSKIEAVLFDLDGTLLDSFPDFLASLENININSPSKKIDESIVRANVSDGSSRLLKLVFDIDTCLLYTSPSPRDAQLSRMPSSA